MLTKRTPTARSSAIARAMCGFRSLIRPKPCATSAKSFWTPYAKSASRSRTATRACASSASSKPPSSPYAKAVAPANPFGCIALCGAHVAFLSRKLKVAVGHQLDQLLKAHLRCPAEHLARFGRVAQKQINFGRAKVARVDLHVLVPVQV